MTPYMEEFGEVSLFVPLTLFFLLVRYGINGDNFLHFAGSSGPKM